MQYFEIGVRYLLGTVFLTSFLGKTAGRAAYAGFVASLRATRLLPGLTGVMAPALVTAELAVCALLVVPTAPAVTVAGLVAAASLLAGLTAGVTLVVRRGVTAPCHCFSASATVLGRRHIARNGALAALAVAGAVAATDLRAHPGGAVLAALGGLVLGALVVRLDDVLELFRSTPHAPPSTVRSGR
ncbi:MauE/DoxX family redox-associated membrane protein [Streptomyces zhihengii]|uniref:MauE/DoxX family redox-associated membrane protein n=1 Tax=Streptomyces zhihengii TaxID=1818004 RepID=UPI0036409A0A